MLYGFISAPPCLSQLPQRPTDQQHHKTMALSRALGPGDMHPAPMFFHLSLFVGPIGSTGSHPGPTGSHVTLNVAHLATLSVEGSAK